VRLGALSDHRAGDVVILDGTFAERAVAGTALILYFV
jgi:hypothetical protein